MNKNPVRIKLFFGRKLREFRNVTGLSQLDFASFMNTSKAYISEIENGLANPSFDTLINYAAFFGIEYYQMGDPEYPVSTFDQLPASTRKAISKLKKQQEAAKVKKEQVKAANKEKGVPGRAKQLHALVSTGFFNKPRTGKDAFIKLNPHVPKSKLSQHTEEIGKITATLRNGKFKKILEKMEPKTGTTAVRYVKKAVAAQFRNSAPARSDMAADE